jgi:hypothetical protein
MNIMVLVTCTGTTCAKTSRVTRLHVYMNVCLSHVTRPLSGIEISAGPTGHSGSPAYAAFTVSQSYKIACIPVPVHTLRAEYEQNFADAEGGSKLHIREHCKTAYRHTETKTESPTQRRLRPASDTRQSSFERR